MDPRPFLPCSLSHISRSYLDVRTVERTPNTPNTLVDTGNGPVRNPLVLLGARVSQQLDLFPDALARQVLHIYRLLVTVDVVCGEDWVVCVLREDGDLNLGIALCEGGERVFEVGVHAARGAGPVAVSECDALAWENEGADTIL